jgi:hypothetical protein
MLVVLEGMDNTGKTTLANKIIEAFPTFKYIKPVASEGPGEQTGEFMMGGMRCLFNSVKQGENWVTDRINLISEPIYGPICRDYCKLSPQQIDEIMPEFLAVQPVIIYCSPSLESILKSINQGFQMDGVVTNSEKIYNAYDTFMEIWERVGIAQHYTYNYEVDPNAHGVLAYLNVSDKLNLKRK